MKPTFAKLGLKMNNSVKTIVINDQEIEVKQYLPINDKLELIGNVIGMAADTNNFNNPIKLKVFLHLEIIFRYTNLNFTDKQKEDLVKLYDILESNKVFDAVIDAIGSDEYQAIINGANDCANAFYSYKTSIMGILESINLDYQNLDLDATKLHEKLSNPQELGLLKDIMNKLG